MMTLDDVVEILRILASAGVRPWLDGGWGVDALVGQQTRAHDDLDLILLAEDAATMTHALQRSGFTLVEGDGTPNFVMRDPRGRSVDVHLISMDPGGDGRYPMSDGTTWLFPAAGFLGSGTVGDEPVRCLTADVAMMCHAHGYVPGDTDFHDMLLLHERLGTPLLPPYDRPRRGG